MEEEGLTKYVDSKLLRKEIQESMDVTEEELERAELQLIRMESASPAHDVTAHAQRLYEDAVSGIELQQYTASSSSNVTRGDVIAPLTSSSSAFQRHQHLPAPSHSHSHHHGRLSPRFGVRSSLRHHQRTPSPVRTLHHSHPHHLDTSDEYADLDYSDDVKDYVTTL